MNDAALLRILDLNTSLGLTIEAFNLIFIDKILSSLLLA